MPDNLSYSKQGTIWVPLCAIRHNFATDFLVESVWLRKLICKVLTPTHPPTHGHLYSVTLNSHTLLGLASPFFLGTPPLPSLQFRIDLQTLSSWLPAYGLILEVDTDGTILRSYHDPQGAVLTEASEVIDLEDRLYIGSYHSRHIVELDMPEGRAGLGDGGGGAGMQHIK